MRTAYQVLNILFGQSSSTKDCRSHNALLSTPATEDAGPMSSAPWAGLTFEEHAAI